jgi:hypothetical protein
MHDGTALPTTFITVWEVALVEKLEVCTLKGLVSYYILFFIDIASRSVHIAGITLHPDNRWMRQIARNVTDAEDGFLGQASGRRCPRAESSTG